MNQVTKLACKTFLRKYSNDMKVEAVKNFPIECDPVVDMTHFIESLETMKPCIIDNNRKPKEGANVQTPTQMTKYQQFFSYINCGLCYAAYPQLRPQSVIYRKDINQIAVALQPWITTTTAKKRMVLLNGQNGVWSGTLINYCLKSV